MSIAPLRELVPERTRLMSLTLEQYHHMIDEGILRSGEPYELLDGCLVRKDRSKLGDDPMTVGDEHAWAVQKLVNLNTKLRRMGCHMRVQQPVSLPPRDEPEPDGAITLGGEDHYLSQTPRAADLTCVIEVADSSLHRDRVVKQRIYANGGVSLYIIVNLADRVVEVYSQPLLGKGRYAQSITLTRAESLMLPARGAKTLRVPVKTLLPR